MTSTEDTAATASEPTTAELEAQVEREFAAMDGETIDDNTKQDTTPSEPEAKAEGAEETPAPDDSTEETPEARKQSSAEKRWAKVLEQRNEARRDAEAAKKELEELKKEEKSPPATTPKVPSKVRDIVRQELEEERKVALAKETRLDDLYKEEPLAKEYSKQIREAQERFPQMSELAAWTMVKGVHGITSEQAQRNPGEASVGGKLSQSHTAPLDPKDMSSEDLEKAIRGMDPSQLANI